jgi:hypothetical protein
VLGSRPRDDAKFREGLLDLWHNLDLCAGEAIDRKNPEYRPFMSRETHNGPARVCWNSEIAPHNFEGFFLAMGDMLVKQGDPATARKVYAFARLSSAYDGWAYKPLLESRIAQAEDSARRFENADPKQHPEIMFNSAQACTACHAR